MLITNLTFVFSSDLRAALGGVQGATFWVYEIPYDIGYDSCRSQRELLGKKCHFYGVKNRVFFCTKKVLKSRQTE